MPLVIANSKEGKKNNVISNTCAGWQQKIKKICKKKTENLLTNFYCQDLLQKQDITLAFRVASIERAAKVAFKASCIQILLDRLVFLKIFFSNFMFAEGPMTFLR